MASITIDRFEFGLDHRKGKSVSDANRLRVLTNAYVTTGRQIKKRACLLPYAALTAGTIGLFSAKGSLQTFYAGNGSAITHTNPLFLASRLYHPTDLTKTLSAVHFCDVYDGYLYVIAEYSDGSVWHHWLNDPGAWVAATAYPVGTYRRPVAANGFIYEVTAIAGSGTSAASEPSWPTTPGGTVVDNAGANQITWTCRTYSILDANNPRSKSAAKLSDRIFAVGDEIVAYHALGNPRDWTTASDAGHLPVGRRATGSTDPRTISIFDDKLAVVFDDSIQLWVIDADPELMAFSKNIPNVGSAYLHGNISVGQDLFVITPFGFRSIGLIATTENYQESDVGNPIDGLVREELSTTDDPIAVWYNGAGQAWWIFSTHTWVYTFSKTGKISAWSRYEFPVEIDAAVVQSGVLYVRSGDEVYTVSADQWADGGTAPSVEIELPYLDLKAPGHLKQVYAVDVVANGSANISFKYDPNNEALQTTPLTTTGDGRSGTLLPVELCCASIATVVSHEANEEFELQSITIYFNDLGPV